jgi:D-alanyl-lipoteichoic acid acyltransferase DltB (MBOAT superfamily)
MLFPTVDFAVFFALVFLGHWLLNPKPLPWKLFMIGASYVFYAWWDVHFIWLLAGVSAISQLGAIAVSRQTEEMRRRIAMAVGVGLTLLPLLYFKYYSWASLELTNAAADLGFGSLGLPLVQLILPVGISFFTFMAISYVVDVYRGHTQVASWIDVFLYLSFFPHLVAGPIVRPDELIPQIDVRRDPRHIDVAGASWLILGGLFKKVVVSSYLAANVVDPVFGEPGAHSALDAIVAVMAYAIVIYADFSGYTDIAIGVAKMLGFQFPQNFDRPYSARSLQDFWRRWHITLSRWLRDYLYIPLGGSKRGERRTWRRWSWAASGTERTGRSCSGASTTAWARRSELGSASICPRAPRPRCSCWASGWRRSRSSAWAGCSSGPIRWPRPSSCSVGSWSDGPRRRWS